VTANRILQALAPDPQRLGDRVPLRDLAKALNQSTEEVRFSLYGLMDRGLVRRCWKGVYAITPRGQEHLAAGKTITSGPKGPRIPTPFSPSTLRSRLWRALRLKRVASVDELLVLAAKGTEGNAREDARRYLNALTKAGILDPAYTRSGPQRFLLLQDTGPQAPQWNKRQKRVFDPNNGVTHDLA
jgi:DNA-binding Lrp family transcriptional regulator